MPWASGSLVHGLRLCPSTLTVSAAVLLSVIVVCNGTAAGSGAVTAPAIPTGTAATRAARRDQ